MRAQSARTLEGTVSRNQALRSIAAPTSEPLHRHELRQSVKESDKPGNRSSGPRFHSTPFHRLKSPKAGCPGARECVNFRQVHSADTPRIRALLKLPPSQRPQNQSDLCRSGKPMALRLPPQTTDDHPVSPCRQELGHRSPKRAGLRARPYPAFSGKNTSCMAPWSVLPSDCRRNFM
jgi:hypothetical protein